MANVDVRSFDGSSMFMALVNGSALNKTGLVAKTQSPLGLKKLAKSDGVDYGAFLSPAQFSVIDEDALVALLSAWMRAARTVYLWGQVYHDSNGAVGIHDIHELTGRNYQDYGDGALLVQLADGSYQGIFLHFNDQPGTARD